MIPPDLRVFQRLGADADHRVAARALEEAGWQPCGTGDWAFVFRSPSGTRAARLSPFDPCAPYTARFYREIGQKIDKDFPRCGFAIIVPGEENAKHFALRYDRRILFMNGGIPVALLVRDGATI